MTLTKFQSGVLSFLGMNLVYCLLVTWGIMPEEALAYMLVVVLPLWGLTMLLKGRLSIRTKKCITLLPLLFCILMMLVGHVFKVIALRIFMWVERKNDDA